MALKLSPELLALYGFIDADQYLKLTETKPHRVFTADHRKIIADAQHRRWAKAKQFTRKTNP